MQNNISNIDIKPIENDNDIKKYINDFKPLKLELDKLFSIKNPISFLFQLRKIKNTFFLHLENIIDYLQTQLDQFDFEFSINKIYLRLI